MIGLMIVLLIEGEGESKGWGLEWMWILCTDDYWTKKKYMLCRVDERM